MRVMVMWHESPAPPNSSESSEGDAMSALLAPVLGPDDEYHVKAGGFPVIGPTSYIAWSEEHLARYERWFPGLGVRVRSRLAARPLEGAEALYLPVTYDSWCVVIEDPRSLPTALEAAARLRTNTAVCPHFPASAQEHHGRLERRPAYARWNDRVRPTDVSTDVCDP